MSELGVDRLLTVADVAQLLNVSERTVRRQTASGVLPHVRIGSIPRYRLERVLAWLEENERGGRHVASRR